MYQRCQPRLGHTFFQLKTLFQAESVAVEDLILRDASSVQYSVFDRMLRIRKRAVPYINQDI